jgi:excisionase family DNA binding protein
MSQSLFSVEQVAERLGLHVRTVRNYVRDGRLKAVRIGKQYRIAQDDLEAFAGQKAGDFDRDQVRPHRHVDVSSIVEIDGLEAEQAGHLGTALASMGNGRRKGDEPLRIESIYDPARKRLKVILMGGALAVSELLRFASVWLESHA